MITENRHHHPPALALETSTAHVGVALGRGETVIEAWSDPKPSRHSTTLWPVAAGLCVKHGVKPAEIGLVFVSSGPGSFTGLRLGVTVARMMAFGGSARLVEVPTFDVVGQNARRAASPPERLAILLDAHRGHVFAATYRLRNGVYVEETAPAEFDPGAYVTDLGASRPVPVFLGEGATLYRTVVESAGFARLPSELDAPRVETVYRLGFERARRGEFIAPRDLVPRYLRAPDAEDKWARRQPGANRPG